MIDYDAIAKLTESFHKAGIENVRYHITEKETDSISVYEGGLDNSSISRQSLCAAEGNVGGFTGAAYIENLDKFFFDDYIKSIQDTALYNGQRYGKHEKNGKNAGSDFSGAESSVAETNFPGNDDIIRDMLLAEEAAYKIDGGIKKISRVKCVKHKESVTLLDYKGAKLTNASGYIFQNAEVLAEDRGVQKNVSRHRSTKVYDKDNFYALASDAADRALKLLDSVIPESGVYPVILENTVFAEIISVILPLFYGDTMLKGMSPLKDKAGQKIFSGKLTLTESPLSDKGRVYRTFDDEGAKTSAKKIIEEGVFNMVLHNSATAREFKTHSTGNAFKKSVQERPSVGVTNVFVEAGGVCFDAMVEKMGKGIVVTSVQGLHAGINTLTGDISLLSTGYMVDGGKIVSGAEQMTVAGNLYHMLNDIVVIGGDPEAVSFSSMVNMSFVTAPSVLFGKLSVAGK